MFKVIGFGSGLKAVEIDDDDIDPVDIIELVENGEPVIFCQELADLDRFLLDEDDIAGIELLK